MLRNLLLLLLLFFVANLNAENIAKWSFSKKGDLKRVNFYSNWKKAKAKISFAANEKLSAEYTGAAKVDILKGNAGINFIQTQFVVNKKIYKGKKYKLTFCVKCTHEATLNVKVMECGGKYGTIAKEGIAYELTSGEWEEFAIDFTARKTVSKAMVPAFFLGNLPSGSSFYIGYVKFEKID